MNNEWCKRYYKSEHDYNRQQDKDQVHFETVFHGHMAGAEYQLDRVAAARGLDKAVVRGLIQEHATIPGGPLTNAPIVNVLELNIALDALTKK